MPNDLIRYDLLVQEALRGVVRKVMSEAARNGLPGEHHFSVTFRTDTPGVKIPASLREKYPEEMMIILQHQFWDLAVTDTTFEVSLHFSGKPERLVVPFDTITGFFDPSVQFGLKFEVQESDTEQGANDTEPQDAAPAALPTPSKPTALPVVPRKTEASSPESGKADDAPSETAKVVSIDAFRKKT